MIKIFNRSLNIIYPAFEAQERFHIRWTRIVKDLRVSIIYYLDNFVSLQINLIEIEATRNIKEEETQAS